MLELVDTTMLTLEVYEKEQALLNSFFIIDRIVEILADKSVSYEQIISTAYIVT